MRLYTSLFLILFLVAFNSCSSSYKVKTGQSAFDLKQYVLASEMLEDEFESVEDQKIKADKAYLLGQTYEFLLQPKVAIGWYEEANKLGYGIRAKIAIAYGYKGIGEYQKSLALFNELAKINTLQQESVKEIRNIEGILSQAKPSGYFYKLNKVFGTGSSSYAPCLYEGDFLVFTSDREDATGTQTYNWTERKFSDLYVTPKGGNNASSFDPMFNTEYNEGAVCFNKTYTEIFFTRCMSDEPNGNQYCRIYNSRKSEIGQWSVPEALPFQKDGFNYGQPALVENDSVLIYSAKSEGDQNGYDLWYTDRFEGAWSESFPMPEVINTQGDEYFPTADGDTLYFSSDFLPGLGGLDIFKTYLKDGKWVRPERLPAPINSPADDYSYIVDNSPLQGRQLLRGFFASNRGNMGIDEVYLFEKLSVEEIITAPKDSTIVVAPPVKKDTTTVVKEEVYDYDIYVAGKVIEQPEKNKPATRPKAIARADLGQKDLNGESISYKSDKNGFFIKQLKGGTSYEFIARADSFLSKSVIISTKGLKRPEPGGVVTINLEIPLERITRDKEYVLENIYYDTDKFFIRNDAKPTLESLARMLQLNPEINIELGSHTDCRADDDYNLELSQNRAQSAVDYLVSLGVNQTRLLAKGYGETQFAVNCQCENCTEAQNQQNRRTSFRIR